MTGARRFSQAISEGDGISVIVEVSDADAAQAAELQGAEGIALRQQLQGIRDATGLPILWRAGQPQDADNAGADACVLVVERLEDEEGQLEALHTRVLQLGLDCVVEVAAEEELELALERIDPEIFLLANRESGDEGEGDLDRVLELLPDVPAGKLAVADIPVATREDVQALERAGVDAVIVRAVDVADLVGAAPPEV